jgi:hypothetical protein
MKRTLIPLWADARQAPAAPTLRQRARAGREAFWAMAAVAAALAVLFNVAAQF